jgi:predicted membrane chloride channel (bestrophin family)
VWTVGGRSCGEMIIYEHLTVSERILQYKGTVWDDCKWHFLALTLVTLGIHNVFWCKEIGDTPFACEMRSETRHDVDVFAWQVFMFPLGFLLGLRSNQAYGRYLEGITHYTELVQSAADLCRQTAYIRTPEGEYNLAETGEEPAEGQASCDDPAKECIIRHALGFLAAVRQDLRNMRLPADDETHETLAELRMHITTKELKYLHVQGIYDEAVNSPLILGRWLTTDLARVVDRIEIPTLIAAMEQNISNMLTAYRGIDKISSHPAPWPYTHLAQTFLLFWVYTLPLCLVPLYGYGTLGIINVCALTLFGLDAVRALLDHMRLCPPQPPQLTHHVPVDCRPSRWRVRSRTRLALTRTI